MNNVNLMGRLVRDVEFFQRDGGQQIFTFSLAINESKDKTLYIDIISMNERTNKVASTLHKGELVAISGKLNLREWQDKNGKKQTKMNVIANMIYWTKAKEKFDDTLESTLPF